MVHQKNVTEVVYSECSELYHSVYGYKIIATATISPEALVKERHISSNHEEIIL